MGLLSLSTLFFSVAVLHHFGTFPGGEVGKIKKKDQLSPAGAETGTELGNISSIVMKIYYNSLKLYLVNEG